MLHPDVVQAVAVINRAMYSGYSPEDRAYVAECFEAWVELKECKHSDDDDDPGADMAQEIADATTSRSLTLEDVLDEEGSDVDMNEVPEIAGLRLATVFRRGRCTSLVSLKHRCVVGDFGGRDPQEHLPHIDFDYTHERAAAKDAGMEGDGGWPGWNAVFNYIEKHPELMEVAK